MHTMDEKVIGVYNEAIALRTRQGAPLASYSIDRKCLRKAALATSGDNIQSLVCFLCGCIYPHREMELKQPINWHKPLERKGKFFAYERAAGLAIFSHETYLDKYGADPLGYFDLRRHLEQFEDWLVEVPIEDKVVSILCCPEDVRCQSCDAGRPANDETSRSKQSKQLCEMCEVPVCSDCHKAMEKECEGGVAVLSPGGARQ